ncbi:MAG TPA: SCO family protein [Vicinamibacterales bacterium]
MRPSRPGISLAIAAFSVTAGLGGCRKAEPVRQYTLKGQIVAIGAGRSPTGDRDVTVKHEDISNFMPAMTMAYAVRGPQELNGFAPGDLISATLVVKGGGGEVYLTDLKKTGHADPPAEARPVKIMEVMNPGDEVPDDPLQDQTGATRRLSDWRGKALAVTFVYTRCPLPDLCPLMDRHFGELQRAIAGDPGLRDRAHLISISFDPAHDTPAVIQAHATARGADPRTWSYLTGASAAIDHIASRFGISVIAGNDPQTITHNLRTAVIDRKGRLVKVHSGNEWTVDAMLADLREAGGR